jgi:hypothetical protein
LAFSLAFSLLTIIALLPLIIGITSSPFVNPVGLSLLRSLLPLALTLAVSCPSQANPLCLSHHRPFYDQPAPEFSLHPWQVSPIKFILFFASLLSSPEKGGFV